MSTPLTIAIAARWMRWRYRIPYLFETGDLWPDAPVQLGFLSNHVLIWILKRFEKVTYQNSARVIALSPDQASLIAARTRTPVYLVPNMADTLFFQQTAKILRLERQFQVEGKFVVSYIGSLSYANGLDYFIDVAGECLRSRLPVHFILCGDGNMRESLVQSADKNRLDNLSFVPFQTHDGVRDLMNVTDACLICYRNVPILETGSPHKYFDGLAAGKIIFTNFGGWISREIHAHHCGFALDPLNPASILDPLKSLLRQPEKAEQMKTAARNLAEEKYARTKLTSHFASLFLSGQPRIGIEQKEILGA